MEPGEWRHTVSTVRKQGDVSAVLSSLALFDLVQDIWGGAAHI